VLLRGGIMWQRSNELTDDRDAYLVLAEGLHEGRGYSAPRSTTPTAFRPPLYPLWLSLASTKQASRWVAISHLLFGAGTIWFTVLLGRRLRLSATLSLLAGLLVAVDPLLVRYSVLPMTETMSTLLAVALLWAIAKETGPNEGRASLWNSLLIGVLFGLNVLCRPTLWAFGVLIVLLIAVRWIAGSRVHLLSRLACISTLCGVMLVVAPWGIRNWVAMGKPILTTTHGGYTLLLGNNHEFYDDVVRQPWGTVWDGSHGVKQEVWYDRIRWGMKSNAEGEIAEDQYQRDLAIEAIRDDPQGFIAACWLRLRRLWGIAPQGSDGAATSNAVLWACRVFYVALFLAANLGLIRLLREETTTPEQPPQAGDGKWYGLLQSRWWPGALLCVSFTLVHLVYWSNARMRAPLTPVICLLAMRVLMRSDSASSNPTKVST